MSGVTQNLNAHRLEQPALSHPAKGLQRVLPHLRSPSAKTKRLPQSGTQPTGAPTASKLLRNEPFNEFVTSALATPQPQPRSHSRIREQPLSRLICHGRAGLRSGTQSRSSDNTRYKAAAVARHSPRLTRSRAPPGSAAVPLCRAPLRAPHTAVEHRHESAAGTCALTKPS